MSEDRRLEPLTLVFVLRHPLYLRLYEHALTGLLDRGHRVCLAFTRSAKSVDLSPLDAFRKYPLLAWEFVPSRRRPWSTLSDTVRGVRDYLRYLDPLYRDARLLRARALRKVLPGLRFILGRCRRLERESARRVITNWTERFERLCPPDPAARAFVRRHRPHLMMVTPLVDLSYEQVDLVKAARAEHVPTALCVASWDNLTNKGVIQVAPDRVVVWNERQREEAVTLHAIVPEHVRVTGAQVYDHWFSWCPSTGRAEYCVRLGLNPERPTILYACSSSFIGREERRFVERWLAEIRSSGDPLLRDANVVIRPHPQNAEQWANAVDWPGVVVSPREGDVPIALDAKRAYFDALSHCEAVVGVNTSVFIEAAVVGKRVLTVSIPELRPTQQETLHFHHLVDTGLLEVAPDFDAHMKQLLQVLRDPAGRHGQRQSFIEDFVRPAGLDLAATPIFIEAIEEYARKLRAEPWPEPSQRVLMRIALLPPALLVEVVRVGHQVGRRVLSRWRALAS